MFDSLDKAEKRFIEMVEEYGLTRNVYQTTQVLFYQAMMSAGFEYEGLYKDDRLFNRNLSDEQRMRICSDYIRDWENRNPKLAFGYKRIHYNEYFAANAALEKLNDSIESLKMAGDALGKAKKWTISKKEPTFSNAIQRVIEQANKIKIKEVTESDYFTHYIAYSRAIYYYMLSHVGEGKQNKFNRFIVEKIHLEHSEKYESEGTSHRGLPEIDSKFTTDMIKSRVSASRTETYEPLEKKLRQGLAPVEFLTFLINQTSSDNSSLPGGRRTAS